jgi:hypothetical protein
MGVGRQLHAPAALPPGNRTGSLFTGGWVGPRAGVDELRKCRPLPRFDPRTFEPPSESLYCLRYPGPFLCIMDHVMKNL